MSDLLSEFQPDAFYMGQALREARKAYKNQEVPIGAVIVMDSWRLEGCTLYVTKEPCPMCAGAIVHCRPERVVIGCADPKGGAAGGWINLLESNPPLNHRCDITVGVMEEESMSLLKSFFREARERKKTGVKRWNGQAQ